MIDVFVADGDLEHPAKGRMKFVVDALGADGFRRRWAEAFDERSNVRGRAVAAVEVLDDVDRVAILSVRAPRAAGARRPPATHARALAGHHRRAAR